MSNSINGSERVNLIESGKKIEELLRRAGKHALLIHKMLGNPVASWHDGKIVIIPPEETPVDENDPEIDYEIALRDFAFVHGTGFLKKMKKDEI